MGINENIQKSIECDAKREPERTPAWREGEKEEGSQEVGPSAAPAPGPAGPSLMFHALPLPPSQWADTIFPTSQNLEVPLSSHPPHKGSPPQHPASA